MQSWPEYKREDIGRYVEIQEELREQVRVRPLGGEMKTIAGADVSLNLFGEDLYAGIVVLSYPGLEVLETAVAKMKVSFPYIPGLLSFREIPAFLECVKKLSIIPSVYMVDGQGIAHPRRLGIASHFGVTIDRPTIGVAKSVLYGRIEGDRLIDPKGCEILGALIQSKPRTNPLVVSPGHLVSLEDSTRLVRETLRGYKLPEPTRRAHLLVNDFRKGIIQE
jgi:deoxyribonuclease V